MVIVGVRYEDALCRVSARKQAQSGRHGLHLVSVRFSPAERKNVDTADKDENTRRAEHGSEREGARDTRASETEIGDRERRSGGSGGTSERTATRVVGEGQRNVRDTFSRHRPRQIRLISWTNPRRHPRECVCTCKGWLGDGQWCSLYSARRKIVVRYNVYTTRLVLVHVLDLISSFFYLLLPRTLLCIHNDPASAEKHPIPRG